MFQIDLLGDEVIEVMPQTQILRLIRLHHVERERLKKEAAVNHESRRGVVGVPLKKIWPKRLQFDRHAQRLLVAHEVEFHFVALEFSLHHFRHLHACAFEIDEGIARNRMAIDCHQDVARLQRLRGGAAGDDAVHEHAPIVIRQPEEATLRRILQLGISDAEIDVAIVAAILHIL